MAKQALINFVTNEKTFEKGKVYVDDVITKEIDSSNFIDVSDSAIEVETTVEDTGEAPKKARKSTKKVPGEELE